MSRELLVFGDKEFKIVIPDDAKVTFGPWSPGDKNRDSGMYDRRGTLRVYADHKASADIIFVQSGVTGYRDLSAVEYVEKIAVEEGDTVWKSDKHGYERRSSSKRRYEWAKDELPEPENPSKE